MSMSQDMVRQYVKHKLATALSQGIMRGETEASVGHKHRFAVLFDESERKFIGETSFDGVPGHSHFIMASVDEAMVPTLDPQPREPDIEVYYNESNTPAAMRRLMDFYNKKEFVLTVSGYDPDHTHTLRLVFAGHNTDQMGRKTEASAMTKGLESAQANSKLEEKKAKAEAAKEKIRDILSQKDT